MRDLGVTQALAPQVPEPVIPLLIVLTALGGPKLVAIASTGGSILAVRTGWIDASRAHGFLVAVALTLSISILLKTGLAMPRPPASLMAIPEDGHGFPSGHATASAGVVTALLGISNRQTYWLSVGAGGFVALIAATRVLLGVHYLIDVIAGIGVGVLVARIGVHFHRSRPRLALGTTTALVAIALLVWGRC
ncbi:phosphatase PAP2 family protein [Halodesulfurarchaeum sp.]|uniref:phosphatase PAP2 family protein n=1 Tax=Halodesulfurarchaeum sp. TaxID=1980530 RepID=UPI001BC5FEC9|nr:phosphatase PAP2 family protein [Halodesulfurarchaeum sp.]